MFLQCSYVWYETVQFLQETVLKFEGIISLELGARQFKNSPQVQPEEKSGLYAWLVCGLVRLVLYLTVRGTE